MHSKYLNTLEYPFCRELILDFILLLPCISSFPPQHPPPNLPPPLFSPVTEDRVQAPAISLPLREWIYPVVLAKCDFRNEGIAMTPHRMGDVTHPQGAVAGGSLGPCQLISQRERWKASSQRLALEAAPRCAHRGAASCCYFWKQF